MRVENTRSKGRTGEDIAVKYLLNEGFQIIARNYFKRFGEIDIIAVDKGMTVFIEVKCLKNENFLNIYETISQKKKEKLIKLAKIWLIQNHRQIDSEFRIDFLGIVFDGTCTRRILHLKNSIY